MHFQSDCDMRSCRDPYYIQVVFEYLLHMGLLDTATALQQECSWKRLTVPYNDDKAGIALKSKLLKQFDCGEEESFFQVFNSSIPDTKLSHSVNKKLVADLYLYFASSNYAKAQDHFKSAGVAADISRKCSLILSDVDASSNFLKLSKFLENNCSSLRKDPQFIPYFSLLFASNPLNHHLFQQAFKDDWISNLRRRLHEYLCSHHPVFKVPDIVQHLPSELKTNLICCFPHQDNTDSSLVSSGGEEERDLVSDGKDLTRDESSCDSNSSQNQTDLCLESDKGHLVHSHKNAALFIRRQNQNMSSSLPKLTRQNISSTESSSSNEKLEEYQHSHEQLKKKFSQLHSDYHNLIGVASELTCALESSVRGQQIDLRETLNSCVQIFPELFFQNKVHKKYKKKASKENILLESTSYEWNLNIARVKRHLKEGSVKTRLLLLQALRWSITRSSSERRGSIMNQFVSFDILDLQGETLLVSLLIPHGAITPHPLQQSVARLLNTFASIVSGRSYLAQNSEVVKVTSAVLQQQDGVSTDLTTKNMLVAALQKLSLRRNQRIAMIQSGVVEWLFEQLSTIDTESSYSLEYGSALLMNLCLHQSAKEQCVPIAQKVFTLLIGLLSTPVSQAIPYINGTLYSLITHPQLNDAATEVGLARALEYKILKQTSADIKTQMEHILKYHQILLQSDTASTFPLPISEGELIDEDDEELDLLGEELDENDPVRSINGELNGEDLLHSQYTLPSQSNDHNGEVNEGCASPLILRPTTPHHFSQNVSEPVIEDSEGSLTSKFVTKTQDLSKKNNWHHRRAGITQPTASNKHDAVSSRAETSDGTDASSKTSHKSDQSEPWGQSHSNESAEKQHFICEGDKQKELPQIAIHLVGSVGGSDTDNHEFDDDSEDVQVASVPHNEPHKKSCGQTMESSAINSAGAVENQNEAAPKTQNKETAAAFTSRPKIPRTPPHYP